MLFSPSEEQLRMCEPREMPPASLNGLVVPLGFPRLQGHPVHVPSDRGVGRAERAAALLSLCIYSPWDSQRPSLSKQTLQG